MKLVFLHGRSQEDKNPHVLRDRWVGALRDGLEAAGLDDVLDERDIVFPFYGDALRDATSTDAETLSVVRFPLQEHGQDFECEILRDCLAGVGITEHHVDDEPEPTPPEGGVADLVSSSLRNEWVQRGLSLFCLLYTSPSPRDRTRSRMPSSA